VSDPAEARRSLDAALGALRAGNDAPLAAWLRGHLFGHVLPFWTQHAFDPQGGLCTCISDAGEILSHEKWLWSQWRAVWVFARIYNTLGRDPVWLERARGIAEYCLAHGWLEKEQGWALLLERDGRLRRGHESIYTDAFAVYGLGELYRATGEARYCDWAMRTADATLVRLTQPYDRLPHFPYAIPAGAKPQGIPMVWSHVLAELGTILGEKKYLQAALRLADEFFAHHYDPAADLVREFVRQEGGLFDGPEGKVMVPGHVIENMWFQLDVLALAGGVASRAAEAHRLTLRHLDLGWDREHGGLQLAVNFDGSEPVAWNFADAKLWWPHTEIMISVLRGWQDTGQAVFLDWYERVWRLCLDHYVDWQHGEWRQKLQRDFTPMTGVVALPVKDPFHLPRSLILQIERLEGLGLDKRG
jgi:N-acylglucosamine 2-epimerase